MGRFYFDIVTISKHADEPCIDTVEFFLMGHFSCFIRKKVRKL